MTKGTTFQGRGVDMNPTDTNALASSFNPAFMGFAQETGDLQVAKEMAALEAAALAMKGSIATMQQTGAAADRKAAKENLEIQIKSNEALESTRQHGWVGQRAADKELQDDRIAAEATKNKNDARIDALRDKFSTNGANVVANAKRENLGDVTAGDFIGLYNDEEFEDYQAAQLEKSNKNRELYGGQAAN